MSGPSAAGNASQDAGLAQRLDAVRVAIAAAERRAGRAPGSVRLVVVTKAAPASVFDALAGLGVQDVGENRLQGAEQRLAGRGDGFRWHFIGHLQSNKARRAAQKFDVFHGVDGLPLLQRLDRAAAEFHRRLDVLVQVNVSGEASKSGLRPEELPAVLAAGERLEHVRLIGLMTMAPLSADPQAARPVFTGLARLLEEQRARHPGLSELSMGMTDDFEVAIEAGATLVRIGRRIVAPGQAG